jgi:hypothetical protein
LVLGKMIETACFARESFKKLNSVCTVRNHMKVLSSGAIKKDVTYHGR